MLTIEKAFLFCIIPGLIVFCFLYLFIIISSRVNSKKEVFHLSILHLHTHGQKKIKKNLLDMQEFKQLGSFYFRYVQIVEKTHIYSVSYTLIKCLRNQFNLWAAKYRSIVHLSCVKQYDYRFSMFLNEPGFELVALIIVCPT